MAAFVQRPLGGGASQRFLIRQADAAIGRVAGNDVVVADPSVSARHARLRLAGGVWTLADLGSVNGSRVDGEPVMQSLVLAPGSIVRLGGVELAFLPQDRWEDSPVAATPGSGPAAAEARHSDVVQPGGYVLDFPDRRILPAPVLIGLAVIAIGVIGYLLARGG